MKIKTSTDRPIINRIGLLLGLLGLFLLVILVLPQIKTVKPKKPTKAEAKDLYNNLEVVELQIDEAAYMKLSKKRKEAIDANILLAASDDFVGGRILYNGESYKGDVRLKGDWVDHLGGDLWSFRVKLKSGNTLKGMRKFSLHHPKTRNYAGEWLFHQLLEEAGILNLQYHFVHFKLTINGREQKDLGVYALEESFDKHLVERGERRESVLLKIDENLIWEERAGYMETGIDLAHRGHLGLSHYENLPVRPFSAGKVLKDSVLFNNFKAGRALFEGYSRGEKSVSEVFNIDLLAKYNAICNVLGANHALHAHNYRVYYNPVTMLLEPVGFDANAGHKQHFMTTYHKGEEDPEYMKVYAAALEKYSSKEYFEHMMDFPGLEEQVSLMQSIFPDFKWEYKKLRHNRYIMMNTVFPKQGINVFFEEITDDYMRLTVENFTKFPIEIKDLETEMNRPFALAPDEATVPAKSREVLSFKFVKNYQRLFINKKKRKAGFNIEKDLSTIQVPYQLLNASKIHKEQILAWQFKDERLAKQEIFKKKSKLDFKFLEIDEENKTITCKKGDWELDNTLIIPKGYRFIFEPGCNLDMVAGSSKIISYSPMYMQGTTDNPIRLFSSTLKGQGFLVLNTKDTSIINNAKFLNLKNPSTNGWLVTGALNFYEAPLKMSNSTIESNQSEDALNCIRGHFALNNVRFFDTKSDAFDGDFVEGTISNCVFKKLGNDAIDVSGSHLTVDNVYISEAGDKGLSAGENSTMIVDKTTVENCEIAVASKDKSMLKISNSSLIANKLGFTAFQKKPEFGVAEIFAFDVKLDDIELMHLIETGSKLQLNGTAAETVDAVKNRMYGVDFGKSSK